MPYIVSLFVLIIFIMTVIWVGIYVALPLLLIYVAISWILSLIRMFLPEKNTASRVDSVKVPHQAKIIDVEYEEIK